MATGRWCFAWVEASETTFGVQHHVVDEEIQSIEYTHDEGEKPSVTMVIRNPRVGLLAMSRRQWAWISRDDGVTVTPLMFGQLLGVPVNMIDETITIVVVADPVDFDDQKQIVAENMKELPYYDPVFIDPAYRDDPDAILEGYSRVWHVDPISHEVTTSDVLVGEDGTEEFGEDEILYEVVQMEIEQNPELSVSMDANVTWTQFATGSVTFANLNFSTYSGDGIVSGWPQVNSSIGGGWTVESSSISDNVGDGLVASYSGSFKNDAKEHNSGDTLSMSWSVTEPMVQGLKIVLTNDSQSGVIDAYSDPQLNIPMSASTTYMIIPKYQIRGTLGLKYDAERERSERIRFTLVADAQAIMTRSVKSSKSISKQGTDVGLPLVDVLHWFTVSDLDVAVGTVIYDTTSSSYQIITTAGHTGVVEPTFTDLVGFTTADGTAVWSSLGTSLFPAAVPEWVAEDFTPLGQVILPTRATTCQVCTAEGTTGAEEPAFSNVAGAVTVDGTASWTSLGSDSFIGPPLENVSRGFYFPTDRGTQSFEYLICVARASLLMSARTVKITFNCRMERALGMTCRNSVRLYDRHIPGGTAIGKVTSIRITADGEGTMLGTVTISCASGYGNVVEADPGTPDVWEGDVVDDDVQSHTDAIVLVGSDVGHSTLVSATSDDGLVFPLASYSAVKINTFHGDPDVQKAAILRASINEIEAANLDSSAGSAEISIERQKRAAYLNQHGIAEAIKDNPTWWEFELNSVTNGPFDAEYNPVMTGVMVPQQIDLEAEEASS